MGILEPIPDEILDLGFEIKDKAIILGMEISNDLHDMESCAETIVKKINNKCNWWSHFNLSLSGRIIVAKSMLYSQVNYLGSFLPFNTEHCH